MCYQPFTESVFFATVCAKVTLKNIMNFMPSNVNLYIAVSPSTRKHTVFHYSGPAPMVQPHGHGRTVNADLLLAIFIPSHLPIAQPSNNLVGMCHMWGLRRHGSTGCWPVNDTTHAHKLTGWPSESTTRVLSNAQGIADSRKGVVPQSYIKTCFTARAREGFSRICFAGREGRVFGSSLWLQTSQNWHAYARKNTRTCAKKTRC